ncbi:ImmA/IrrE family metallo-endopeptidase [Dyadobacter sp. CY345]|uniref:ImmA/IrrE family metallo-endopeptidase n=1 Tax=Dyadobacter sp. CY345 TaxID=2909335 RepID=UPI001F3E4702|nr:ImmA/IrrE family metallo-endopeptidase [Dyadobacter sp. CY345]MCF2445400.1 ImmA/IrrE family metallo-endopeptidase [Dyadobacter sp. CY345]
MNNKRRSHIEEVAIMQLREYDLYPTLPATLYERCLAVDVEKIIIQKGIKLVPYDFGDDISGVLLYDGIKATIGYNKDNGPSRRRFTMAHELGHFVLNHQRHGIFVDTAEKYFPPKFRDRDSSTGEFLQEKEANAFAASLLMPDELVLSAIEFIRDQKKHLQEDYNLAGELAKYFWVSPQAMLFRLDNLDFFI